MALTKGLLGSGLALAAAAGLAGAIGLTGCKAPRQNNEPGAPVDRDDRGRDREQYQGLKEKLGAQGGQPAAAANGAPAPAEPVAPAEAAPAAEPGAQAALEAAEADRGVTLELAQKYYETALALFTNYQYQQALANCEKALGLNPDLAEAKDLKARIGLALGRQPESIETYKSEMERRLQVQIEQTQVEIRNHLAHAKEAFGQGKYKEAIADLEAIEEKLRWKPYDIGLNAERDEAHAMLGQARELRVKQEAEFNRLQRQAAEKVADDEERGRQTETRDKIKHLFRQAIDALERKEYSKCEDLCDDIVATDAGFEPARELKQDSIRARNLNYNKQWLEEKVEGWKKLHEDMAESMVPYSDRDLYQYPDRKTWAKISARQPTGQFTQQIQEEPELAAIKSKLDTLRIDLDFTDANLYDIIEFIREFAKINIEIHPDVKKEGIADKKITFQMKELVLKSVLKLLLRQYGLDYAFEDRVLIITKPEIAEGQPVLEVHDVRDLLQTIRDFPGPDLELSAGAAGGQTGATFGAEQAEKPVVTQEQLLALIKENIAPQTWEERRDEVSLAMTGNGQLLVIHTPKVQQELRDFLKSLRSFTGAMVSIESRFIAVTNDFFQDIGHEFRGHPNVQGDTSATDFPDGVTDNQTGPLNGGVTDNTPFPGIETHREGNEQFDLRFRTAFGAAANNSKDFATQKALAATLGSVTGGDVGGLALQYSVLNNPNIEGLLTAVEKSQKATILRSPRVTAFNTQRSHLMVETQQSYIKDFDTEIATNSIAFDPVIGILQDGLVFDVRPIISNDRKYITLELRPSLAQFLGFRRVRITDLFGGPEVELPQILLQQARTTIRMPDRGTVLIAGLKNLLDRDEVRETPLLAQIPVLGFLFKRTVKVQEKANLILLITAEIIDAAERERDLR